MQQYEFTILITPTPGGQIVEIKTDGNLDVKTIGETLSMLQHVLAERAAQKGKDYFELTNCTKQQALKYSEELLIKELLP